MKQCTKCKEWKEKKEFDKDKRNKTGSASQCKKCRCIFLKTPLHRKQERAYSRELYKNPIKPESKNICQQKLRQKLKEEIMSHYGGRCLHCGEKDLIVLTIDHINNDGAEHRRQLKNLRGMGIYYWLKKNNFPREFQVLCANCNMRKENNRRIMQKVKIA